MSPPGGPTCDVIRGRLIAAPTGERRPYAVGADRIRPGPGCASDNGRLIAAPTGETKANKK